MASPTQWTWLWANSGRVEDRGAWYAAVPGVTKRRTQLSYWTTTKVTKINKSNYAYSMCNLWLWNPSWHIIIIVLFWDFLKLGHIYIQYMINTCFLLTSMMKWWMSNIKDRFEGVTIWTSHYPETLQIDAMMLSCV